MPQLCEAIVANQTPYVDTVSGASLTSNAVIEAAAAALAQAGLTFEKAEVVNGEDEVADCDVLVIGMGASGSTGNNVSGMSVAAYVNIEGTGLGFALTSGRLAGANAAAASKSFRPLPKVVRFKA